MKMRNLHLENCPLLRRLPIATLAAALASVLASISVPSAQAATWLILPDGTGSAPTIQAGIDSAAVGDTVLVAPGTYIESLYVDDKDISLLSIGGSASTRVESPTATPALEVWLPTTYTARVSGFTFVAPQWWAFVSSGGGVPEIEHCEMSDSRLGVDVGTGCSAIYRFCTIQNNELAGVWVRDFTGARFEFCSILGNQGDGVSFTNWSSVTLTDCTIQNNDDNGCYTLWYFPPTNEAGSATLERCVVTANGGHGLMADMTYAGPLAASDMAPAPSGRADRSRAARSRVPGYTVTDCAIAGNTGNGFWGRWTGFIVTGGSVVDNGGDAGFILGGGLYFTDTVVRGNGGGIRGAYDTAEGGTHAFVTLTGATVHDNGTGVIMTGGPGTFTSLTMDRTILSATQAGPAFTCGSSSVNTTVTCCDLWANAGGDSVCASADDGGNFSQDPFFCNAAAFDFQLADESPCLPGGSGGCGLVGALGAGGCSVTAAQESIRSSTWARVKAAYR